MEKEKPKINSKRTLSVTTKKRILVMLIGLILLIALILIIIKNVNQPQKPVEMLVPNIAEVLKNTTNTTQEGITLKNIQIKTFGSEINVSGELENEGEIIHSVELVLSLYNEKEQLRGTSSQVITEVAKNENRKWELRLTGDYTDLSTYAVTIKNVER